MKRYAFNGAVQQNHFDISMLNVDKVWVLSIDGGGIRGLIPAMILEKLENNVSAKLGKDIRIADMFDMVAGTSTGSILSLGLTVSEEKTNRPKYKASDLVEIYKKDGSEVFKKRHILESTEITIKMKQDPVVGIFDYAYLNTIEVEEPSTTNVTIQQNSEKFGDKTLKDTLSDVLIPAYNITETKVAYFTNDSNSPDSYKISDVILASSAAPTYFPAKEIDNNLYIDGGVFMNDPAFEAYLEAKKNFLKQKTLFKLVGSYLENLKTEQDFNYYRLQCDLTEEIPLCDIKPETLEKLESYANNIIEGTEFENLVNEIVEDQEN
nr:10440_t:CDS:2 [Entrophospora candida]